MSKGYVNKTVFIATDASDNQTAASITNSTGFKVNFAPNLALTPVLLVSKVMILLTELRKVDLLWDFN